MPATRNRGSSSGSTQHPRPCPVLPPGRARPSGPSPIAAAVAAAPGLAAAAKIWRHRAGRGPDGGRVGPNLCARRAAGRGHRARAPPASGRVLSLGSCPLRPVTRVLSHVSRHFCPDTRVLAVLSLCPVTHLITPVPSFMSHFFGSKKEKELVEPSIPPHAASLGNGVRL